MFIDFISLHKHLNKKLIFLQFPFDKEKFHSQESVYNCRIAIVRTLLNFVTNPVVVVHHKLAGCLMYYTKE